MRGRGGEKGFSRRKNDGWDEGGGKKSGKEGNKEEVGGKKNGEERERDGGWQFPVITANPYFIA